MRAVQLATEVHVKKPKITVRNQYYDYAPCNQIDMLIKLVTEGEDKRLFKAEPNLALEFHFQVNGCSYFQRSVYVRMKKQERLAFHEAGLDKLRF